MKPIQEVQKYVSRLFHMQIPVISVNDCAHLGKKERAVSYKNIPGPKPFPILGNTWRFIPYIGNFEIEHIDKVSQKLYEKYGPIVKLEGLLGRPDMVFLFDPDEIENVFRQEDAMPLRPSMPSLNYYKHVYKKNFFGSCAGVIAVHGENWQNFRSQVNRVMLQPRATKMYVKSIVDTADEFVQRIEKVKTKDDEMPPDFLNEIHKWSLESIARIALDVRLGCLEDRADLDTQTLIDAVNTFFINVPILELKFPFWKYFSTPTYLKFIKALDVITDTTIKHVNAALAKLNERSDKVEPSILQKLIELEGDTKVATVLALDMFLVGIDTTSNAVASILYQLAINPDKQDILHQEIQQFLPTKLTLLGNESLENMSYLKACIKETMRMYPVVIGNGRCTTRDTIICGYHVPKGVQVVFQHYVISNLEKYFEKSDQFLPERWLNKRHHHPFASLPFGFGRRMCLGRRFAELEIQTLLAKVIQHYRIEYHHEKLDYHIHPMYTPNGPLKLRFIKKH